MQNLQPSSERGVVKHSGLAQEVPADQSQVDESRYGVFETFEAACAAMIAALEKMTLEEADLFVRTLERNLRAPAH